MSNAKQISKSFKILTMVDLETSSTISVPDLERYIATLSDCKPLSEQELRQLCEKAREVFYKDSNVQPVKCPVTVVGDLYEMHFYSRQSYL